MYQQSESIEAELSAQIFEWMALAHGSDLLTTEIMNELYVSNYNNNVILCHSFLQDWSDIFSFSKEHLFSSYIPKLSQRLNKVISYYILSVLLPIDQCSNKNRNPIKYY